MIDLSPVSKMYAIFADSALKEELEETRKVRDEWCAEYTRVRDEMAALKAVIAASEFAGDIEFEMAKRA